jgi:hypothetical protein
VFALLVFQWDYTTVSAISYLFGVVAIVAGVNEFFQISVSTTGWKWIHGLLGVLFIVAGIYALWHPYDTFATLSALVGLFDITDAFITASSSWWLQLVVGLIEILLAFWGREPQGEGDPARSLRQDRRAVARITESSSPSAQGPQADGRCLRRSRGIEGGAVRSLSVRRALQRHSPASRV